MNIPTELRGYTSQGWRLSRGGIGEDPSKKIRLRTEVHAWSRYICGWVVRNNLALVARVNGQG